MDTQSIKQFCNSRGFTQLTPSIRVNVNGYAFITFIDAKNAAENVYFSKASAKSVSAGQVLTKELLSQWQVAIATNAEGELRTKIISNSERIDINSLLD